VERIVTVIERIAAYFVGILALITFGEAALRYGLRSHIPDGFIIGQTMQGIAICWGIATAAYADRHISVDIVYLLGPARMRRICDIVGYTLNLVFFAVFGYAITYKVFDIMAAGEISEELAIPLWTGYSLASLGVLAAVATSAIRWWQVVVQAGSGTAHHG
jgi:TRAP-type C4-dicarboxylate transport system permease small subunit